MEATATLRYFRMSAQKVRLVADLIRGNTLEKALDCLDFLPKRAAKPMAVLLRSAAANAGNKDGMDTANLYVGKVLVDEGPMAKRFMPRAMGRATPILKKSCHIHIVVEDRAVRGAILEDTKADEAESKDVKKLKSAKASKEVASKEVKSKKTVKASKEKSVSSKKSASLKS